MAAGKSSRINRQYKTKVQNPELEGVRAWPQEPRGRHDLAERGCDCRVDTTEERSPRRAASILEPRDPDRIDAAGRLRPTASPDGGVSGLAAQLDEPRPQGPGPHHPLAPLEVPIRRFTPDGAYDHRSVYDRASAAGTENVVIVIPPRRSALSAGAHRRPLGAA